jgi:hypothetical protein
VKYFLDTEFSEDGYKRIDLISLALVCEDGREFYAVAWDGWHPEGCNDWVKANVLPYLGTTERMYRKEIARKLQAFVLESPKPEFWGYFADYDWVLFCQLFGRMVDLPKHFPYYCRDIKQWQDELGVKKSELPEIAGIEHNALEDARHIKAMHVYLTDRSKQFKQSMGGV